MSITPQLSSQPDVISLEEHFTVAGNNKM